MSAPATMADPARHLPALPGSLALSTYPPIDDQANDVFAFNSLPSMGERSNGSTLPQWSHENGETNPPQESETNPPPMVADDDGEKTRRTCPLPSIPGITWKPKPDDSFDCYCAPKGRFTAKPQYIGRVGKKLLAHWTTEHGKSKRQLRPVVEAWIKAKKREKGIS